MVIGPPEGGHNELNSLVRHTDITLVTTLSYHITVIMTITNSRRKILDATYK